MTTRMRWNSKPDRNQAGIVEELKARGYDVDLVFRLKRLYDVLVSGVAAWSNGRPVGVRVELKTAGGSLTPAEKEYWAEQRHGGNLIVAECVEDILDWFEKG